MHISCGGAHIKWGFKFKCAEFQNILSSADAINICAPPTKKNQNTNIFAMIVKCPTLHSENVSKLFLSDACNHMIG